MIEAILGSHGKLEESTLLFHNETSGRVIRPDESSPNQLGSSMEDGKKGDVVRVIIGSGGGFRPSPILRVLFVPG